MNKDKEIMDYLEKRVFGPALAVNNKDINKTVKRTITMMEKHDTKGKLKFFINVLYKNPQVEEKFKKYSLTTFEDIAEDFLSLFKDYI